MDMTRHVTPRLQTIVTFSERAIQRQRKLIAERASVTSFFSWIIFQVNLPTPKSVSGLLHHIGVIACLVESIKDSGCCFLTANWHK